MSSINVRLREALAPVGLPVVPEVYTGEEPRYITTECTEDPSLYADGGPYLMGYSVVIRLFLPTGERPDSYKQGIFDALASLRCPYPDVESDTDLDRQSWVFSCKWAEVRADEL